MECPRCKHEKSSSTSRKHAQSNVPTEFTRYVVLKSHEAFRGGMSSSINKEHVFFDSADNDKKKMNRPVLLRSLDIAYNTDFYRDGIRRSHVCLAKMEKNRVYTGRQMHVWVATRSESTAMADGTIYLVVRDKFDFYVRLVISNWSYIVPTRQIKSSEQMTRILDDLLPIGSIITLFDPHMTVCSIDGQSSLRCDAPNLELMLVERMQQCFVIHKLDELRDRGNQAYIHGDIQAAIDYYTFSIHRIEAMTRMVLSKENDSEMILFADAHQLDLCRFHSNRSACYLRERLYSAASIDTFVVTAGRCLGEFYDELFLKCLYRHMCANIGLQKPTTIIDKPFDFYREISIDNQLRIKFTFDFNRLESAMPRLKREHRLGEYDLPRMFVDPSLSALFNVDTFHATFISKKSMAKRSNGIWATRNIPAGQLLLVERAFAFVHADGDFLERRLLNEVEKRLILSPNMDEFNAIRAMPSIRKWYQSQIICDLDDTDDDDDNDDDEKEAHPKTLPWSVLVETQQNNPFRSKSLLGWWPNASNFTIATDSMQKSNCFWFVCGEVMFIFTFSPVTTGDELIIANAGGIRSFLEEQRTQFELSLGIKVKVPLNSIFDHLQKTQIFFD